MAGLMCSEGFISFFYIIVNIRYKKHCSYKHMGYTIRQFCLHCFVSGLAATFDGAVCISVFFQHQLFLSRISYSIVHVRPFKVIEVMVGAFNSLLTQISKAHVPLSYPAALFLHQRQCFCHICYGTSEK